MRTKDVWLKLIELRNNLKVGFPMILGKAVIN